jgi:YVTN family beta-propeller protein
MTSVRLSQLLLLALGLIVTPSDAQQGTVRIVQTNAAGDNIHLIDPATNRVVDVIMGITIPHGVTASPDGRTLYISNEPDHTLDVVSTSTLRVTAQIPLSDRPNNVAITPDGRKVYVAIAGDAWVDVIDTREQRRVNRIRTLSGVHNVYVTPDGRYAVAGMIPARTMTVIDTQTDQPVWSIHFPEGGVRPMAFETNPDGSTKNIFVQISDYHGFFVVDFATRQVVKKVAQPQLPFSQVSNDALQGSPAHGLAVSPDGRQLWSTSKPNSHVYAYSLPDLEYLGGVEVGHDPDWLTMTPDGRYLYSANAGSNTVTVIDTQEIRAIATIPVGQVPKRNHTVVIR